MAVVRTGAMFKSFTFDGESSRDYGIYITGSAVFNAPERDVEMVEIPGRNGAYALDRGRFANIEITYPAGMFAGTDADFAEAISAARNWLASKKGYVRLQDEYNPGEYRLAVYKSGLDVDPATLSAGEFDLTFECMPQRFLVSGGTGQAVASGGTITNPTRFSSRPLLEVYGYGGITLNGAELSINSSPLGNVILANSQRASQYGFHEMGAGTTFSLPVSLSRTASLNTGDAITVDPATVFIKVFRTGNMEGASAEVVGAQMSGGPADSDFVDSSGGNLSFLETFTVGLAGCVYGTPQETEIREAVTATYTDTGSGTQVSLDLSIRGRAEYDGAETITFSGTVKGATGAPGVDVGFVISSGTITGNSTKSALGEPAYIDLDIGEAYKIEDGAVVGINNAVSLPGDLPELNPGENTVTFDSTVTELRIIPRWWKV